MHCQNDRNKQIKNIFHLSFVLAATCQRAHLLLKFRKEEFSFIVVRRITLTLYLQ